VKFDLAQFRLNHLSLTRTENEKKKKRKKEKDFSNVIVFSQEGVLSNMNTDIFLNFFVPGIEVP